MIRICFSLILLVFSVNSAEACCATNWQWANPLPQGNPLRSVASNGSGTYVAVGDLGTVLQRLDGRPSWMVQKSHTKKDLRGVTWGNSRFVAVGDMGTILTSPDGIGWTLRNSSTRQTLFGITWCGAQFVAVGSSGTIVTSWNGITWTSQSNSTTADLYAVTWGNGQFVTVGSNGTVLTSPAGGNNWTVQNSGISDGKGLSGVTWGNSVYVAVGDLGRVLTSPDGIHWSAQLISQINYFTAVAWNGALFVAVGNEAGWDGGVVSSSDGINWTKQTPGIPNILGGVTSNGSTPPKAISQFIAVGDAGAVFTSNDGLTNWTQKIAGTDWGVNAVVWAGNQFFGGWNSGLVATSPDGKNWTRRNNGTGLHINALAWDGNDTLVGTQWFGGTVSTSSDGGQNWVGYATGVGDVNIHFRDIAWGADKFVIIDDHGSVLTSPDGKIWTPQASNTTQPLAKVIWNGTQFVVVGNNGTLLTSSDGVTWTKRSSKTTNDLWDISWSGTRFVAVGNNNTVVASLNGQNWFLKNSGRKIEHLIWTGAQFLGVSTYDHAVLTSEDGVIWYPWVSSSFGVSVDSAYLSWIAASPSALITGTGGPTILSSDRVTLNVATVGSGTGTVKSRNSVINCGNSCSASYANGTGVTLTAVPTNGSTFSGWTGDCSGTGTCHVCLQTVKNVTAIFAAPN